MQTELQAQIAADLQRIKHEAEEARHREYCQYVTRRALLVGGAAIFAGLVTKFATLLFR